MAPEAVVNTLGGLLARGLRREACYGLARIFQGLRRAFLPISEGKFLRILPLALLALPARAESVADLLRRADALDAQNQNAAALPLYLRANELRPHDAEVLRLIARQYLQQLVGESASQKNKELAGHAVDYAKWATAADPRNADARLCLAICYGKAALLAPPRQRMESSRLIRDEAEAAVRLDPTLDDGWHVLGRWNYELANLNPALRFIAQAIYGRFPDASNERAAECFEKAIALQPRRVIHHGELGRTYTALGRKDEARAELKRSLDLPSRDKDDDECKARARQALAGLD